MSHHSLDQILADLYALDPTLKAKEDLLRPLVQELLEKKPTVDIDPMFVKRLRTQLITQETTTLSLFPRFFESMTTAKLQFAGAALAISAIVALGASMLVQQPNSSSSLVGKRAFGSLAMLSGQTQQQETGTANMANVRSQSGGGGGMGSNSVQTDAKMMIWPAYSYQYRYVGDAMPTPPAELPVYRHRIPDEFRKSMGTMFSQ